jgi:hypothetical protein
MKKVYIRRRELNGYLPKEILAGARVSIGSIYVGRQPLKGFEDEEAKKHLKRILDVPPDHPDWARHEREFWANMTLKVPFEGVELDITLDENGEANNPQDYATFRWCQRHRQVGATKAEMDKDALKKFYIYDPEQDLLKSNNLIKIKKDADKEFIKISTDVDKMKRVLRVLTNQNTDKLSPMEVENNLYGAKDKEPAKFLKVSLDKHLDVRAEIMKMVERNVLRKIGNQIIHEDETIGADMNEAIIYFNNKKNSGAINAMRAKLKTLA